MIEWMEWKMGFRAWDVRRWMEIVLGKINCASGVYVLSCANGVGPSGYSRRETSSNTHDHDMSKRL